MARKIYLIEIYDKAVTGFSTYKKELFSCLNMDKKIQLHQIILGSPVDEFLINVQKESITFKIPNIVGPAKDVVGTLLRLHIEDSYNTVFLLNYAPSAFSAKMLREYFPNSKIVVVIHDFMWATYLMGDINRFKKIILHKEPDLNDGLIEYLYNDGIETFKLSDKIVCLSDDTYKLLKEVYSVPLSKLQVIPNGLSDVSYQEQFSNIRKNYHLSLKEKILLYVGRVTHQKGIWDVLYCFKDVLKVLPNTRLVIAGDIESKDIAMIAPEIRLKIILLGILSQKLLYAWYRTADACIHPSYYEQCSYVGIEMKMFGQIVIASDGFGIKQMFNPRNSVIASIGNRDNHEVYRKNISSAIIKALTLSNSEREYYRKESRKHYMHTYCSDKMREKYKQMFNTL